MVGKIEAIIKKAVGPSFAKASEGKDKKFLVTASEKPEFGHYSTNVGFFLKKNLEDAARRLREEGKDFFEKVEIKGKFINFWISKAALIEELAAVLRNTKKYEYTKEKKQKINLEFISANPTGPLTMANGRGGFFGDVLANLLRLVGHKVTREYYINDAGNQVRLLGESVLAALGKMEAKEEYYKGDYVKKLASALRNTKNVRIYEKEPEKIGRLAAAELLGGIQKTAKDAGIKFDVWYSEYAKLRKGGLIKKVLGILEKKRLVEKREGALWLKTSEIADEKDRVLVKSDGQPTYFLADLAYHYDKFVKRKFDRAINIWGADHHGYVKRLESGIKELGIRPDRLKIIITQLVRLVEGGKEVKMSKRKGEFVTLDELISEVGKDAARFFFLLHTPESHMDFDLSLAKERSLKNPVYYVQYAFVRMGSILTKANSKFEIRNSKQILNFKSEILNTESELKLVQELVKLPDVILQTAEDYQVSRLARYAMEIAKAIHNFYEKERVIGSDGKVSEPRRALVAAAREILGRLLDILGVTKLEKM